MSETRTHGTTKGAAPPRALIITLYGLYSREIGGWLSVRSLIRLLAEVGVDSQSVRSAVWRLKQRGLLVPEKRDRMAGYTLSSRASDVLFEGDQRIFQRSRTGTGHQWLLAVFSVPESERDKRHKLRALLTRLGFGTVSAGAWIAPAHVEDIARETLGRAGLTEYLDLFRAEHLGFRPLREQVSRWWDLESLNLMYSDIVAGYRPTLDAWNDCVHDDAMAFADYVGLLTSWRRLPYLDPGLPTDLLPDDWRGAEAAETFFELRDRIALPARRHAASKAPEIAFDPPRVCHTPEA
ncbi:PaaX family transcriptional regulator C-terminal domain-containing protein [Janibacter alittae]|uniref:PaaX family transcriptional regulator C-terminal domain-containing protein n=1 Tax=Janibacter alittae TaxID=3115209 RepID=A0ABZ2MJI1_9MICO